MLIGGIIAGVAAAAYLIYKNWDKIKAWWNSWTLKDIFAPVIGWVKDKVAFVKGKWQAFMDWWKSLTIWDVFASLRGYIDDGIAYIKGQWNKFTDWLSSLNPFKDWTPPAVEPEVAKAMKAETLQKYGTLDLTPAYMRGNLGKQEKNLQPTEQIIQANRSTKPLPPVSEQEIKRQIENITILNKMSEGFTQRVAEMTAAWQPFKASLGEGFEQIYSVMQSIADKIRGVTIPAVNELASSLSKIAAEISSIVQAGTLEVEVRTPSTATAESYTRTVGGMNKGYRRHALGGIFSQPHLGLVAEAGREAVIPLENKVRGIPLWKAAGEEMGLKFGSSTTNNNDNRSNSVTLTPTFNITVNGGEPGIEQKFRQIIEEIFRDMMSDAERISFA